MFKQDPEIEWQQGSRKAWIRLGLGFLVSLVLLGLLYQWVEASLLATFDPYGQGIKRDSAAIAQQANRGIQSLLVGFTVLMASGMAWNGGKAARIIRHERYPAPGETRLFKTRILRGAQARRKGWMLLAKALFVGTLFIATAWEASHLIAHEMIVSGSRQQSTDHNPPVLIGPDGHKIKQ